MSSDTLKGLLSFAGVAALLYWMMRAGGCGGHAHGHAGRHRHGGDEGSGAPRMESRPGPVSSGPVAPASFKDAEAIEVLRSVDTLVVDKTGTLTEGKPRLVTIVAGPGWSEGDLVRHVASLERGSEHPLAAAILAGAAERGVDVASPRDFRSITGKGVTGQVDGRTVALGNAALLAALGADAGPLAARADELRGDAQTVMYLVADGQVAGPRPR